MSATTMTSEQTEVIPYSEALEALAPPRILHITEAPLGGVLTYLQELVTAQSASPEIGGVAFLVPDINLAPLRSVAPADADIRFYHHGRRSLLSMLRLAIATRRAVRNVRPDIVHIHSTIAGGVVRLCLLFSKDRPMIVYCPHGWFFTREGGRLAGWVGALAERLLTHMTDAIICVSDYEKRQAVAVGIPASKCHVVKNGIGDLTVDDDGGCEPEDRNGKLTILYVGRFDQQKGFDVYLRVLRRLGDKAVGIAVGKYIVSKQQAHDIPSNVTVIDWCSRDQLQKIYASANVVLVPSKSESFGLVAAEAMRAGVSVFASRVGGLPELVVDSVTGRLFEPDDVDQITELLLSTPRSTLADYGRRGRIRFQEYFTASRMNSNLIAHYREMVRQDV